MDSFQIIFLDRYNILLGAPMSTFMPRLQVLPQSHLQCFLYQFSNMNIGGKTAEEGNDGFFPNCIFGQI